MKKIVATAAAVLLATCLSTSALASDNVPTYKDMAGITPDSILYPIDTALDNLKIILTTDEGDKVQIEIKIANERLGEAEVMAQKGKTDLAEQSVKAYTNYMEDADSNLNNAVDKDKDADGNIQSDTTKKTVQDTVIKQEKSIEVLENLEENLGGNAKQVIQKVITMQQKKKEAVAAMVNVRHELNSAKKDLNAAKVEVKKAEKSGDDEALKTAQSNLTSKTDTFNKIKDEYKKAVEQKKSATSGIGKTTKDQVDTTIKVVGSSLPKDSSNDKTVIEDDDKTDTNGSIVSTVVKYHADITHSSSNSNHRIKKENLQRSNK